MNEKKKFETTDLVKLGILLVLLLFAVIIFWQSGKQSELVQEITPTEMEITEIEAKAATQVAGESADLEPGSGESDGSETGDPVVGAETGNYPEIPDSEQVLLLVMDEGVLINEQGIIVYVLSEDQSTWMPAVPADIIGNTNGEPPQQTADGNWVLINVENTITYQWDPQNLSWNMVEQGETIVSGDGDSQAETGSTEPGETDSVDASQPEEITGEPEESGETSTGSESKSTPDDASTSDSDANTADTTGGADTQESGTGNGSNQAAVVEIPESLLQVPKTYAIQRGEFVYCISRRFDLNPTDVLILNNLKYYSVLQPGMVLKIPVSGNPFPAKRQLLSHPAVYTVEKGDSVHTIACKFGDVFPEAIIFTNNLTAPYVLTPGQTIQIP